MEISTKIFMYVSLGDMSVYFECVYLTYEWSDCRGENRTTLDQKGYARPD